MIKRIVPLTLLICITTLVSAQKPESARLQSTNTPRSALTCPAGVNPEAGTSTQALFPNAQSNDVRFMCFGDSMSINHNQDWDLSGDPNTGTQAGIGYIFYNCQPTITGPELTDVESDPCLITTPAPPPPPFAQFWLFTDPVNWNGNTVFWNGNNVEFPPGTFITLMDFFNGGNPVELTFAPVTVDDFFANQYEVDGNGTQGGCIDVNTNDAFSIVFLNPITASNINTNAGANGCGGSFIIEGGLPEYDNSNYDNSMISITLASDPTVQGSFINSYSDGDEFQFSVPQPGLYDIVIEDGVSCGLSLQMNMNACVPVTFNLPDSFALSGTIECVDITVQDFVNVASFEFVIQFDNTILSFNSVNSGALGPPDLSFTSNPNFIAFSFFESTFTPISLGDGTTLFQLCFNVIGNPGDVSPLTFGPGAGGDIEVSDGSDFFHGFNGQNGSITVVSNNIALNLTSCAGRMTGPNAGTGSFTIDLLGGAPPYSYTWVQQGNPGNNGSGNIAMLNGSATINGLPPGTYDVTIMDATGDTQVGSITIADADPMFVQTDVRNPSCPGDMNGAFIILNVSGGVPPFSYAWSTGSTSPDSIFNLGQGQYALTVTDQNGCMIVEQRSIGTASIVIAQDNVTNVSCNGNGMDGSIAVSATGGTPPYQFDWNNNDMGPTINNLAAGQYCVTVTDDRGCTQEQCIDVTMPAGPMVSSFDSTSVTCFNDTNGSLTVNATAGSAAITGYTWQLPGGGTMTGDMINGLSAGTYYVTITAADGCMTVDSASLYAPPPVMIDSMVSTPPTCPNDMNGSAAAFVSGGTTPYTYTWSTGLTGAFSVLPSVGPGTYYVTVTGANGCNDAIDSVVVESPPRIDVVIADSSPVSCNNDFTCDGTAMAIASGGTTGTGFYNFFWSNGESSTNAMSSTATQLCKDQNWVIVADLDCASDTFFFDISAPPVLTFDLDSTRSIPVSCFGGSDGSATIGGEGGTPGYTYLWDTGASGPRIDNLPIGSYGVTITDVQGCTFATTIQLTQPDTLIASIDPANTIDISCNGEADGQIAVVPTGGTPSYTYSWQPNVATSSTAVALDTGLYVVTVTDANACTDTVSYWVNEPEPVSAVVNNPPPPICFGGFTFVTIESATGGNGGPYEFTVDNGPPRPISQNFQVFAGVHTVTVFDGNGCSVDYMIDVQQPPPVVVSLGVDVEIQLGDTAVLRPNYTSSVPIDSLQWSPLEDLTCLNPDCSQVAVGPLSTTQYTLTVIDEDGCIGIDEIIVEVDKNRNVFIPNIFTPDNDGINDFFNAFIGPGVTAINFMRVYDRWGELVYERTGPYLPDNNVDNEGWDGSLKGKRMNSAVFVYLIEVEFIDGITLLYRGDVTLLR